MKERSDMKESILIFSQVLNVAGYVNADCSNRTLKGQMNGKGQPTLFLPGSAGSDESRGRDIPDTITSKVIPSSGFTGYKESPHNIGFTHNSCRWQGSNVGHSVMTDGPLRMLKTTDHLITPL